MNQKETESEKILECFFCKQHHFYKSGPLIFAFSEEQIKSPVDETDITPANREYFFKCGKSNENCKICLECLKSNEKEQFKHLTAGDGTKESPFIVNDKILVKCNNENPLLEKIESSPQPVSPARFIRDEESL